jgi:hypothetical protein
MILVVVFLLVGGIDKLNQVLIIYYYGNLGNCLKSGSLFSRNALRPS